MARIRRVIRRIQPERGPFFDEQFWPIIVSMFVLGGVAMGMVSVYLDVQDVAWYANRWTWLMIIPVVVCLSITALRKVESRWVRRGLQLSAVLCLILHLAFTAALLETRIFSRFSSRVQTSPTPTRPRIVAREYESFQLDPQRRREAVVHQLVETETPDPDPQQQEQEPLRPDQVEEPEVRQPQVEPVDEPTIPALVQPQAIPNLVKRNDPAATTPRQSDERSLKSRQTAEVQPRPSEPVAIPQVGNEQSSKPMELAARASTVTPAPAPTRAEQPLSDPQPAQTPTERTQVELARRVAQSAPQPTASATAQLERTTTPAIETARSAVAAPQTPAPTRATPEPELTPSSLSIARQATESPTNTRPIEAPLSQPTVEPTPVARQQNPAQPMPQIASVPTPADLTRPRLTPRPDVATVASTVGAATRPSRQDEVQPQATAVERVAVRQLPNRPTTATASPAEATSNTASETALTRSNSRSPATPTANPSRVEVARANPSANTPQSARSAVNLASQQNSQTTTTQANEVTPQRLVVRPQAVAATPAVREVAEPTVASQAVDTAVPRSGAVRRMTETTVPEVASTTAPAARQSLTTGSPRTAADRPVELTQTTPADRSARGEPTASATQVARANTTGSSPAAQASAMAANAPTSDLVGSTTQGQESSTRSARRQSASDQPNLATTAQDQPGSPARTPTQATPAASLIAATPAPSAAETGSGAASVQPSQTALTRSLQGITGVGQSANLDRELEASQSPSLVASGSARRAETTSRQPDAASLSSSTPAVTRQSFAGEEVARSTVQATLPDVAAMSGATQPSDLNASASAALARADAAATRADVSAAAGVADLDVGPTRVIDEGGLSRATGGGQPEQSPTTEASSLARATRQGGAAAPAVNATADLPAATTGTGAGTATASELAPAATLARRGNPGPAAAATTAESVTGTASPDGAVPQGVDSGETDVALAALSRAQGGAERMAEPSPDVAASGGVEDEEERAKRLARALLGGSLAMNAASSTTADLAAAAANSAANSAANAASSAGSNAVGTAAAMVGPAPSTLARANTDSAPSLSASTPFGDPADPFVSESPADAALAAAAAAEMADAMAEGGAAAALDGGELVGQERVRRAEAAAAAPAATQLGGGSTSPPRAAAPQLLAQATPSLTVALPGMNRSSGQTNGQPVLASELALSQAVGGPLGRASDQPIGGQAGTPIPDAVGEGTEAGPASLARAASRADGPRVGTDSQVGAPFARSANLLAQGGPRVGTAVDVPGQPSATQRTGSGSDPLAANTESAPMARQSAGAIRVDLSEVEGPGGLGNIATTDIGIQSRRARTDSLNIQFEGPRFTRSELGGLPQLSTNAAMAAESFRRRGDRMAAGSPGGGGSTGPETEAAIERGLAFLAQQQRPDGSWTLQGFGETVSLSSDTAATGLALLAFQGAGYHHREFKYAKTVERALTFLRSQQQSNGDLYPTANNRASAAVWFYSHAIASIALCEAYGMTQDPELREPAQKSLNFIVQSQNPTRGGWRYAPQIESDTSVTGWMTMALKSGQLAELEVPEQSLDRVQVFLDQAQAAGDQQHLYRYNPYAPDTPDKRHGRAPNRTMTAVGLLMRLYGGWHRDHPDMVRGANYLLKNLPAIGTKERPQRDTYYWYYATQLMFHMGGDYWKTWNAKLHPLLVNSQIQEGPLAGSWEPRGPVPDAWAPHAGRLYVTTMNLLSLEVTYRHLPLYDDTGR
jgi:hypothetical protein